jgi:hypothetical protein
VDCSDNDFCTDDACDPLSGCYNPPHVCNDGNPCTDDSCDPATGCVGTPDDSNTCSDGDACTTDACVGGVCTGTFDEGCCDDGDACTIDTYDPGAGCVHTLRDADGDGVCDDTDNCPTTANSSQTDQDGDGLGDACDECPNSDMRPTVIVRGCDSRVANDVLSTGCTIADLLARCRLTCNTQRSYLNCVWEVVTSLRAQGAITGKEASKILKCASRRRDHDSRHGDDRSSRDDRSDGGTRGRRDDDSSGHRRNRNHGQRGRHSW